MKNKVYCNGRFLDTSELALNPANRAFKYGDGFFETMLATASVIHFFDDHYKRIVRACEILQISPAPEKTNLHEACVALINRNRLFKGVSVRISIFRDGGGKYDPQTNVPSVFIETNELEHVGFMLNTGLVLGEYKDITKKDYPWNGIKSCNAQLYVLAALHKEKENVDDCIIFNDRNCICETISSNLFLKHDNRLLTPSLSTGCVEGIMRNKIIKIAEKFSFEIIERDDLQIEDILKSEEVFTTNAVRGVQWVKAFRQKRFFNFVSRKLVQELNALAGTNSGPGSQER